MRVGIYGSLQENSTGPSKVTEGVASGLSHFVDEVLVVSHGEREEIDRPNVDVESIGKTTGSVKTLLEGTYRAHQYEDKVDMFHPLEVYPFPTKTRTIQWTIGYYQRLKYSKTPSYRAVLGDIVANGFNAVSGQFSDVVCISPESAKQARNYLHIEPETIIPLGVYADEFWDDIETDDTRVLFPGVIEQKKGHADVLSGLDTGDDYTVDIVGGVTDEDYYQTFSDWHHRHHGFVPRDEFNERMAQSDIVVIGSYHDPYPTVGIEALAHESVVVVTEMCGFGQFDWARPENGIYVVSDQGEAAEKIKELSKNNLTDQKAAAQDLARTMTWKEIGSDYAEFIKERA
jgi:glycosyltransferase involved in cell wall biosynthesis